jgi:hypothetical protein
MSSPVRFSVSSHGAVLLGRTLAACVHPIAAWQYRSRSFRVHLLAGYFMAGYVAGLMVLVFM